VTLSCITNTTPGSRPCLTRGEHLPDCDWDECEGCKPREAHRGFLCAGCWDRLEQTDADWGAFLRLMRGVVRAVTPERGARSVPGPRLPLSPLQVDVDTVTRIEAGRHSVLDMWVSSEAGAAAAVRFTRAARHVMLKHPTREAVSRITRSRCGACQQRTLVYEPPQWEGADATVQCLNYGCGNVMDHTAFERLALVEAQCCRRCRGEESCGDAGCTCHRFAPVPEWQRTTRGEFEPFDPTRPEHAELLKAS
jgi:hypothetical protein